MRTLLFQRISVLNETSLSSSSSLRLCRSWLFVFLVGTAGEGNLFPCGSVMTVNDLLRIGNSDTPSTKTRTPKKELLNVVSWNNVSTELFLFCPNKARSRNFSFCRVVFFLVFFGCSCFVLAKKISTQDPRTSQRTPHSDPFPQPCHRPYPVSFPTMASLQLFLLLRINISALRSMACLLYLTDNTGRTYYSGFIVRLVGNDTRFLRLLFFFSQWERGGRNR